MPIQTVFINEENKLKYKTAVRTWLMPAPDFYGQATLPQSCFWQNAGTINEAFEDCDVMVALNDKEKVVGYMTWFIYGGGAEIVIVEVREDYRRQGIFKKMLTDFCKNFTDVFLLTASPLQQSEEVFRNMSWGSVSAWDPMGNSQQNLRRERFFKVVKPGSRSLHELPNGFAIAVCTEDYYQVSNNLDKSSKQYFQIDLNKNGKLREPIIVTGFHDEHYIGIYFNQELIAQGKAKHLFKNAVCNDNFLVISKMEPNNLELFSKTGLFSGAQKEMKDDKESPSSTAMIQSLKRKRPDSEAIPAVKSGKKRHITSKLFQSVSDEKMEIVSSSSNPPYVEPNPTRQVVRR